MKRFLLFLLFVCSASLAYGQATSVTVIPRPYTPINVFPDAPLSEATGKAILAASGGSSTASPATASTDPADATVTTTSATVLTLTTSSKNALVRNTGSSPVRLGFGATATSTAGFYLGPGDAWSMNSTNLTTGTVTAVAVSGSSTLAIHEGH